MNDTDVTSALFAIASSTTAVAVTESFQPDSGCGQ